MAEKQLQDPFTRAEDAVELELARATNSLLRSKTAIDALTAYGELLRAERIYAGLGQAIRIVPSDPVR